MLEDDHDLDNFFFGDFPIVRNYCILLDWRIRLSDPCPSSRRDFDQGLPRHESESPVKVPVKRSNWRSRIANISRESFERSRSNRITSTALCIAEHMFRKSCSKFKPISCLDRSSRFDAWSESTFIVVTSFIF